MTDTSTLQELALAVNASRFAPGKTFFDSYLGPPSNNPQKSTDPGGDGTVYTFVDKFNAPATLAIFFLSNTLASVTSKKTLTQTGEYYNLYIDNKTTSFALSRLRNARMTLCADFVPEGQMSAPKEVVSNSIKAMNTLRRIQDMTEERFNRWANVPVVNYGLIRPSITGQDVMVAVLHSQRLFDCGSVSAATAVRKTSAGSAKRSDALKRAAARDSPTWLESMPDSLGRYESTIHNLTASECIFVVTPDIYDYDGNVIPPTAYSAEIGDRQFMLAECHIKM
ncbi:hypothetical protein V5O48_002176 [Marasmius crinis-equi]|uniref:Uncharacterized protein n=1 Tax=Marasmius crinis-equi TaxID=585013 RepID=A0ABR3FWC4_9AGAR